MGIISSFGYIPMGVENEKCLIDLRSQEQIHAKFYKSARASSISLKMGFRASLRGCFSSLKLFSIT